MAGRRSARAIIVKDDQILVMRRNKYGNEFFTIIGGGIEDGETTEQALYREVDKESSVKIANHRLVIKEDAGTQYGTQEIFLVDYVSGDPALHPESEEAASNKIGLNTYTPVWLPIIDLADVEFMPKQLQELLVRLFKEGFPDEPVELTISR